MIAIDLCFRDTDCIVLYYQLRCH